jgi:hypothetical protein
MATNPTFWTQVIRLGADRCWLWLGHRRPDAAARLAWIELRGALDDAVELQSICGTRRCINPDHRYPCHDGSDVDLNMLGVERRAYRLAGGERW